MKIAEYNCYLSLGANLGDRQASLRAALQRLDCLPGSSLSAVSSFYETAPWGRTEQPPFLNLAACLRTQLTPERLLDCCQKIEADLGRERKEKWGPRVMDIDLLHAPGKSIDQPRLQLPHPYLLSGPLYWCRWLKLPETWSSRGSPLVNGSHFARIRAACGV